MLLHRLALSPVVAAVRSSKTFAEALDSKAAHLFLMGGTLQALPAMVKAAHAHGKGAFVHLDLIRGISSTDKESLAVIHEYVGADGIVTPKGYLVKEARRIGLYAILHLFVIDSYAYAQGLALIQSVRPDGVEIMPGIVPKVVSRFAEEVPDIPIIASGLIETRQEAAEMLNAGATTLSVSASSLWNMSFEDC